MTRCGLAERVKGWPPGCGFAGFARLPQVFSWLGMREDAWGRRAARGRLAFPRALPACRGGFSWRGCGRMRWAAVRSRAVGLLVCGG